MLHFSFIRLFIILTLGVLLISCNNQLPPPDGNPVSVDETPDLEKYLDSIKPQFDAVRISKTIEHNGIREQMWIDKANWEEEMDFFYSSRISKIQLEDKYYMVTRMEGDTSFIIIQAKNPSLFTREMVFTKLQGEISAIEINNQRSTFLFELHQNLKWNAAGNSEIIIRQKSLFSDPTFTALKIDFQP